MKKLTAVLIFIGLNTIFCENDPQIITELVASQQQLEYEKQNLIPLKQNLDTLKSQQAQQYQQVGFLYPSQITSYNIQIQNLTDILQNLKNSQTDIDQRTAVILKELAARAQLQRLQIEPGIASLERDILQTQEQMYIWTNTTFTLNSDQRLLLESLQNTLKSQKQQLAILQEQRLNIAAEELRQTSLINSAAQQQKAELAESQEAIQDEIFSIRAEIEGLQSAYAQAKMSYRPLTQQISQAQQGYDEQLKKIKMLEASTLK